MSDIDPVAHTVHDDPAIGPPFCEECSREAQAWIKWPCRGSILAGGARWGGGEVTDEDFHGRHRRKAPLLVGLTKEQADDLRAERDRYRNAILDAIPVLAAEHCPDPTLKGRGGCVMCWPKDGSWPCQSALVNDLLRAALDGEGHRPS